MDHSKRSFLFATVATCLLCLIGCNTGDSNVGSVTGTLTVDGEAIADALVTFMPTTGRASAGFTDENGFYELKYVARQNGAVVGEHKVYITSEHEPDPDYSLDEEAEPKKKKKKKKKKVLKEKLPAKYSDREKTKLTATVKSGSNTIDFDLITK